MPEVDPSATADGTDPAQVRLMTVVEGAGLSCRTQVRDSGTALRCPTQAPDSATGLRRRTQLPDSGAGLGRGQYRPRMGQRLVSDMAIDFDPHRGGVVRQSTGSNRD